MLEGLSHVSVENWHEELHVIERKRGAVGLPAVERRCKACRQVEELEDFAS